MASIQAEVMVPDVNDDPQNHKFKWGDLRTLYFIVKVDGARGGETVIVNIHNKKDQNNAHDIQAFGTTVKGDDGSFGVILTFGQDQGGSASPAYHLGTGPDQQLIATVTTDPNITVPDPYTYTTV